MYLGVDIGMETKMTHVWKRSKYVLDLLHYSRLNIVPNDVFIFLNQHTCTFDNYNMSHNMTVCSFLACNKVFLLCNRSSLSCQNGLTSNNEPI